jgi:hypothetical protein
MSPIKVWWSEEFGELIEQIDNDGYWEIGPIDPEHFKVLPADAVELAPVGVYSEMLRRMARRLTEERRTVAAVVRDGGKMLDDYWDRANAALNEETPK